MKADDTAAGDTAPEAEAPIMRSELRDYVKAAVALLASEWGKVRAELEANTTTILLRSEARQTLSEKRIASLEAENATLCTELASLKATATLD